MSDQTVLNPGVAGDTIRTVDNAAYTSSPAKTAKTQVIKLDVGGQPGESLVQAGWVNMPVETESTRTGIDHPSELVILQQIRALLYVQAQYMHAIACNRNTPVTDDPDTMMMEALNPVGQYASYFNS